MDKKNEILIECRGIWRTKKYSNLTVTLDIPLRIFSLSFSLKLQIQLLIIFLRRLIVLIRSFNNSQYMYLIFKEYVFDENVYLSIVNKKQVDKIITGPGNYKYQPIIFEISEFIGERVMLWYSSNSFPIIYKSKKVENKHRHWEIFLKHMTIDTHWVWTNQHKKYLKQMVNSNIVVKGSMMFYNCPKKLNYNKKYDLVIFDITPQNSKSTYTDSIHSFPIAKECIEDIIESVKLVSQKLDRDISIYIKHKRVFDQTHSSRYINYIDWLVKNRQLFVLPLGINLYKTIASSRIIIGFPFTSPVIIGHELKVPSIHYSSSNIIVKYNQTSFIQNKFELRKFIEISLGK
jgi:polysaccharide biosynthesis PFTS motif protein